MVFPPPSPTFNLTGITPEILDITLILNFSTNLYHKLLNKLDSDHIPVLTILRIQAETKSVRIAIGTVYLPSHESLSLTMNCTLPA